MSVGVEDRIALPVVGTGAGERSRPSARVIIGLAVALCGLALPWLGLNMSPSLSAWHLSVALGAVPLVGHVTYGEILGALLVAATVSTWRAHWQPTNTTRACGGAILSTGLLFVLTTRVMGADILLRLSADSAQTQVVDRQILEYHFAPPTSYFGFTPDATTRMILNALRMGWLLTVVAGAALAGRRISPPKHRRLTVATVVVAGIVVACGFASGVLADVAKSDGIALARSGQAAGAEREFARALSLNPQLDHDSEVETELGVAQGDAGQQSALAWFAEASSPPVTRDGIAKQMFDYTQALSMAPTNQVLRDGFADAVAEDMVGANVPVDLSAAPELDGMALLSFTYGHYAYEVGDDDETVAFMQKTLAMSSSGELQSLAYTYLALAQQSLGHPAAYRRDIVKAVQLDTQNVNGLGREIAAGLYTPGAP
jgi:hypothetical protein